MAFGFAPYLLKSISEIALENDPQMVLDPAGAFNLLNTQKAAQIVSESPANNGHRKTVQVKYQQRATPDQVADAISCDNVLVPAYNEVTVAVDIVKQIGIYIPDETIAKYMDDASNSVRIGQPSTPFMREFLFSIMTSTNALIQALDVAIIAKLAANVGINAVTGVNTATPINLPLNTTVNPLGNGITKILTDYQKNSFKGRPQVLGAGLFWDYLTQQPAKGLDYAGVDTRIQAARFDFFPDLNVDSIFNPDEILVVAPNTIQRVDYITNRGFRAGMLGQSYFFTIDLPMQIGSEILPITFDAQLKYFDCTTTLIEAYTGNTITAERGWALFVNKQMGVFQTPNDAFQTSDRLTGVNGSLLYAISNDCEVCEA